MNYTAASSWVIIHCILSRRSRKPDRVGDLINFKRMSKIVIKTKALICNNKKYFTTNAEKTLVGAYGTKQIDAFKSNYFFPFDNLSFDKASVKVYGPYELDTKKTSKINFNVPMETPVANGSGKVDYESLKTQKLKFIQIYINQGPIIDTLNKNEKALDYLRSQKQARVVNCVFVAIESEFSSKIDFNSDINARSNEGKVEVNVKLAASGSHESKLKLAPNTTIAYELAEPIWNDPKTKIMGLDPDFKGIG